MIYYLKCDADGCDHQEIPSEPMCREHIGRKCPKCGSSLLTEEDFEAAFPLWQAMDLLHKMGAIKSMEAGAEPKEGDVIMSLNAHDGEVNINLRGAGK